MGYRWSGAARAGAGVVTALVGAGIASGAAGSADPTGRASVVAFLVAAPMLAVYRLLPGMSSAVALVVAAAGAITVNATVAQAMLTADVWSRPGGVIAVGLVAALVWLVPSDAHPRPRPLVKEGRS
jgi:hypothetical protein